jgi:hypothetical protein
VTELTRRGFLLGVAALAAGARAGAAQPARKVAPQAVPDTAFDSMFTAYGNNTDPGIVRWLGGDSTWSIRLPDGRTIWIFSDTFVGHVVWDGSRGVYTIPQATTMIHNCYVVQQPNAMTLGKTLFGGTPAQPLSLINPAVGDGSWYWTGDATLEGSKLRQLVTRWRRTGPGVFDVVQLAVDIATFSLPGLQLQRIDSAPHGYTVMKSSGLAVSYAAGIREDSAYTYVYGVEDGGLEKWLHVARSPAGNILAPWQFWTGRGWSADPQTSARLVSGSAPMDNLATEVGASRSVSRLYNLVDQDFCIGDDLLLYTGQNPWGPWTRQGTMYTCPEHAAYQQLGYDQVYPYNSKGHPEFCSGGRMLVTYNVNSFNPPDVYADASIYRPRFLRAQIC